MKKECNIIRDILPLYVEKIVSDDTREYVEAHLAACEECRAEWVKASAPAVFVTDTDVAPLKTVRRKLRAGKARAAALAALVALALLIAAWSAITAPLYLPYSPDLIRVEEINGAPVILFSGDMLGVTSVEEDGAARVIRLSAWTTEWNRYSGSRGRLFPAFLPVAENTTVFYSPCDGSEDVLLCGETDADPTNDRADEGSELLPRLSLGYILLIAATVAMELGVAWWALRRKERLRVWAERLCLVPVSYIAAHLLIKGATFVTYSAQRDFSLIFLAAIPVYGALTLALKIYRNRKTIKNTPGSI